jgi:hypothetical protein
VANAKDGDLATLHLASLGEHADPRE